VATGRLFLRRMDRVLYDEAIKDLRQHCQITGERDSVESEGRLVHLDAFSAKLLVGIGSAGVSTYMSVRQTEGVANGTIDRELGVLGRMLRLAYENGKLLQLPVIQELKEAKPR
jgi:hypothetical protein